MKLNQECVRDLLLYLEENLEANDIIDIKEIDLNYSKEELFYTAQKLGEAYYIDFNAHTAFIENSTIKTITWDGHQFLDNIRDSEIWKKTKSASSKFASVSISFLGRIASEIITKMILQG